MFRLASLKAAFLVLILSNEWSFPVRTGKLDVLHIKNALVENAPRTNLVNSAVVTSLQSDILNKHFECASVLASPEERNREYRMKLEEIFTNRHSENEETAGQHGTELCCESMHAKCTGPILPYSRILVAPSSLTRSVCYQHGKKNFGTPSHLLCFHCTLKRR